MTSQTSTTGQWNPLSRRAPVADHGSSLIAGQPRAAEPAEGGILMLADIEESHASRVALVSAWRDYGSKVSLVPSTIISPMLLEVATFVALAGAKTPLPKQPTCYLLTLHAFLDVASVHSSFRTMQPHLPPACIRRQTLWARPPLKSLRAPSHQIAAWVLPYATLQLPLLLQRRPRRPHRTAGPTPTTGRRHELISIAVRPSVEHFPVLKATCLL